MKRQSNALLTALIFHELFFLPGEGGEEGGSRKVFTNEKNGLIIWDFRIIFVDISS